MTHKHVVEMRDVHFSYDSDSTLENVNFIIEEKDFLAVIGPNGGGKTTLIKLMLGFLTPSRGAVRVFGHEPKEMVRRIGYVPQFAVFDRDFPIQVRDVVLGGLIGPRSLFPWRPAADVARVMEALRSVGIENLSGRIFGTLSGGQKQRVLIARALVSEPAILVLDEPTASVDNNIEKDIYELFHQLNKKLTIILVTHDLGFVSPYINRVACVNRQVRIHNPSDVTGDIIAETYHSHMNIIQHKCGL